VPYANIDGVSLYYEDYGAGPAVMLTPGGRTTTAYVPWPPCCRPIIHDRRNCGKSDVVIGGELSEQHLWAEEMAALLKHLGAAPDYVAGGSAGSRTSLTVAVRQPSTKEVEPTLASLQ
jgi:pimeloyl-ACP methyl ester carboxylesterase